MLARACFDNRLWMQVGFDCVTGEELVLSRTTYREVAAGVEEQSRGALMRPADRWRGLLCPIPLTQNHKLVAPLFPT